MLGEAFDDLSCFIAENRIEDFSKIVRESMWKEWKARNGKGRLLPQCFSCKHLRGIINEPPFTPWNTQWQCSLGFPQVDHWSGKCYDFEEV